MIPNFRKDLASLPVAYTFNDKRYLGFYEDFAIISSETDGRVTRTVGLLCNILTVTVDLTSYEGYDAVCWRVNFANKTDSVAPHLSDLSPLCMDYVGVNTVLNGIYGDNGIDERGGYAPYEFDMSGKKAKPIHMEPPLGRGTYNYFPYFHIQDRSGGLFIAMGWPILWKADFTPDPFAADLSNAESTTHIEMGQTHFDVALMPGEDAIMPSITLLSHASCDRDAYSNLWRHFYMDCITRKVNGDIFPPHLSGSTSWLYAEMQNATEANQIEAIDYYCDHGIPIDFWWMDAGWYFRTKGKALEVNWMETGTWLVDTDRFPTEFAAVSEHAESRGVKTLLWFEPEVARLSKDERDEYSIPYKYQIGDSQLVNIGDPEFVDWCFERFSSILDKGKISLYRQDYGINPESIFNAPDINTEGRVGIVENRYARGYWALWDKLIERYPDMMIDDCAAGGGRNDIDSMRRSVPLHKTDYDYSKHNDKQSMHQSLFAWLPYFGTCSSGPDQCNNVDPYMLQSSFTPWINLCSHVYMDCLEWDCMRHYMNVWKEINRYFREDYYPLTEWTRGDTAWRGWEFFDPKTESGFFQLFRPENAQEKHRAVVLKALDPDSNYELWNRVTDEKKVVCAKTLLHEGFAIDLEPRSAVTFTIRKI